MTFSKIFLFLFIISFALLTSCNSKENDRDREQKNKDNLAKKLSDLEQSGLASQRIIDEIFLGYKFGMTQDQVLEHTSELLKQGKLIKDYGDTEYFEIDSKLGTKYKGKVYPAYFDSKLVSIQLIFEDPNPILLFGELSDLYESKYGAYDYLDNPLKEPPLYVKIWVRDNLKIVILSGVSAAYVKYIDLRFEKQKIAKDSLDEVNKADELKKGL